MPTWVEFLDEMKELFSVSDGPKLCDLQQLLTRAPQMSEGFLHELEKCPFLHCVIDNWYQDGINVEVISALLDFFPGFANVYARYAYVSIDQCRSKFVWTVNGGDRDDDATYPLHLACKNRQCPDVVIELLVKYTSRYLEDFLRKAEMMMKLMEQHCIIIYRGHPKSI